MMAIVHIPQNCRWREKGVETHLIAGMDPISGLHSTPYNIPSVFADRKHS
jgi:hypothetical protein